MGSVYGYEVESELPLQRLRPGSGPRGVLRIRRGPENLLDERGLLTVLHDEPLPRGARNSFALAAVPGGLLVACGTTGAYRLDPEALTVTAAPAGSAEGWEHRLLSVVVPLLLAERGDLVLHAAAVEIEGGALIVAGPTTSGKSTLALAFSELGYAVLSEDGVVIDTGPSPLTWPAAAGVRVRDPGTVAAPRHLRFVGTRDVSPLPPGTLLLLDERGDELEVERLAPREALLAIAPHLLHAGGRARLGSAFAGLAALVGAVPAFRGSMPDDLDAVIPAATELTRRISGDAQPAET